MPGPYVWWLGRSAPSNKIKGQPKRSQLIPTLFCLGFHHTEENEKPVGTNIRGVKIAEPKEKGRRVKRGYPGWADLSLR